MGKILIIDDEEKLRSLLGRLLRLENYQIEEAGNLKLAKKMIEKDEPDVILCDVKLPDGNGVDFISDIKKNHPLPEIILLTAYGNIGDGVQAMKNGAFDYITKGDDNNRVIPLVSKAMEKAGLKKRVRELEGLVGKKYNFNNIIGNSDSIRKAIVLAQKVAPSDTTVLLLGETGTGKEVFAQAVHNGSSRVTGSFVALNCSAFSKDLLESELFGYKAGAFTGATKDKKGLLEEADRGTLFLDELGEMPLDLQAKLLRVIETGEFIRIGDTKSVKVNVRFIAATNRDLESQVKSGSFREDLFYRLNVFAIRLPSLKERKDDIPLLSDFYISLFSAKTNKKITGISKEAAEILRSYEWKGNIRELKNVLERAVILEDSDEIQASSLPFEMRERANTGSGYDMAAMEKHHILKTLEVANHNKTEAARLLNIGLTTLYRKLAEYDIKQ